VVAGVQQDVPGGNTQVGDTVALRQQDRLVFYVAPTDDEVFIVGLSGYHKKRGEKRAPSERYPRKGRKTTTRRKKSEAPQLGGWPVIGSKSTPRVPTWALPPPICVPFVAR